MLQEPLPGVLDRRMFERVKVEIGWCDVCGMGKAVYRSREAQAKVWEERLPRGEKFEYRKVARCDGPQNDVPRECDGS